MDLSGAAGGKCRAGCEKAGDFAVADTGRSRDRDSVDADWWKGENTAGCCFCSAGTDPVFTGRCHSRGDWRRWRSCADRSRNLERIDADSVYCCPLEVGADIIVGSLIKNLGGGIAPNGAYIAGKKELIDLAGERLTLPGEGREVGPTLGINKSILQGIFFAPSVVASALKTAVLASKVCEDLGYQVEPKYNDIRCDIVQNIIFNDPDKLIKFCQGIQAGSPIDSFAIPEPWDMPGYVDKVIMAAGAFTQGSSIEISCDGPIREPYIAYLQGGLTYEYGKLAVKEAIKNLQNN